MRPQKLRSIINKGIDEWLRNGNITRLVSVLPQMERQWSRWAKEENDYRTGKETYGYEDFESIYNNMTYISDRWRCAFRLKWIIDGLSAGYIKQSSQPLTEPNRQKGA